MIQDKIKSLIDSQKEKSSKKNLENLFVFIIILVITIIAINTILNDEDKNKDVTKEETINILSSETVSKSDKDSNNQELEEKLENILSKIDGVGKVSVLITYSQTSEVIAMYNENLKKSSTEEEDTGGGTRKIIEEDNSKEIVYKDENGEKIPVTQKVILPKIEGAIITAEGAKNATIKTNIIQAVEAVTGLASHKIQVFVMRS